LSIKENTLSDLMELSKNHKECVTSDDEPDKKGPSTQEPVQVESYQTPDTYPIWLIGREDKECLIETIERSDKGILEDFSMGSYLKILEVK
jgi:hypothetical protein